MNESKWFLHPILILITSITAVCLSLSLYIYWYVEASSGLKRVLQKTNLNPDQVLASQTWVVILVLSILVGIILLGILMIFIYHQKTFHLYRLQNNFINNFTHELKTPVTSMKLFLETFRKYDISREDQLTYIGYMVQDADRLSHNINRILDLAKIESKTYQEAFVRQDLVQVVTSFFEKNRHLFGACEISIQNPTEQRFFFRIRPILFDMLLMNLFTNAIKYNKSGKPRLDVVFESASRIASVRFADNGIGIPKAERKKIFKKFYQIGRSDDRSAKGTGLGLYLVDLIARLHKGRIKVESGSDGKGSVFVLYLPLRFSGGKGY